MLYSEYNELEKEYVFLQSKITHGSDTEDERTRHHRLANMLTVIDRKRAKEGEYIVSQTGRQICTPLDPWPFDKREHPITTHEERERTVHLFRALPYGSICPHCGQEETRK